MPLAEIKCPKYRISACPTLHFSGFSFNPASFIVCKNACRSFKWLLSSSDPNIQSSKYTRKLREHACLTSSIAFWNVVGAPERPNGTRKYSNNPQ
ncbi:unnamed protein product [Meloidogyne enterolobii]|uniref:Uncharacterized protein n=1 Tax=Meloidogyne enterolobii TaxID=390850 RepID=A0ACB0YJS6_MELEN